MDDGHFSERSGAVVVVVEVDVVVCSGHGRSGEPNGTKYGQLEGVCHFLFGDVCRTGNWYRRQLLEDQYQYRKKRCSLLFND